MRFMAYVWDTEANEFIYAPTFEELSNVALDVDNKVILSNYSADKITSYSVSAFDPNTKNFVVQKSLNWHTADEEVVYKEEKLENGKMETIAEFTLPESTADDYLSNAEIAKYYKENSEWGLNSSKWNNYLITAEELVE